MSSRHSTHLAVFVLATIAASAAAEPRFADSGLPRCGGLDVVGTFVCRVAQIQYKLQAPFDLNGSRPRSLKRLKYDQRVTALVQEYKALRARALTADEIARIEPAREKLRTGCKWVYRPRDIPIDCGGDCPTPKGEFCGAP